MTTTRQKPGEPALVRIVAAVLRDGMGRLLLVRKQGTRAFMQPGGKPAPGESDLAALARELHEELGCTLDPASARFLGTVRAPAANEPGYLVEAALYAVRVSGPVRAAAEIAELLWLDPRAPDGIILAPLTRDQVLPRLRRAQDAVP